MLNFLIVAEDLIPQRTSLPYRVNNKTLISFAGLEFYQ